MIALLLFITGLILGFYGWTLYSYVKHIYELLREKFDVKRAGVVTPTGSRVTRNQPIDLSTEAGGVIRPSPNKIALDHRQERERNIKRITP